MKIIQTVQQMRAAVGECKRAGKSIGFVPTMGALHAGHLSLVRAAREQSDVVIASVFVNPTQFGPNEDFVKYPRTFENDCALLAQEKTDIVFSPATEEIYPPGATTYVTVEGLSERLDGKSRPGHFRGVTTVVNKLFNIVEPEFAYFGQKDAAQVAIIRKMVRDLLLPMQIVVCPIIREADGLAMSSRNSYLSGEQRQRALVLYRSLQRVSELYANGERKTEVLKHAAAHVFQTEQSVEVDYIEIVDTNTLEPAPSQVAGGELVAVAAKLGSTRLIDNMVLQPSS
jgi:pantoate--beta-alanine ligase